jgi:hypothetical protein
MPQPHIMQVAAEALRVCEQMVSVIRPNPPAPTAAPLGVFLAVLAANI